MGPVAEQFLTGAAATGVTKLGTEIAEVLTLGAAHGAEPLLAALERAVAFGRWRADDIRSILAPELLVTAKTQRWKPEEFLRTLLEAEIASRDEANVRTRMRQAAFPVAKRLEEFDVAASSIPPATFDYLASLEWIRAAANVCLIGPAGTGKSHTLTVLGIATVEAGHRVRYFTTAEMVETLYRGLADNSVGKVIENRLRNELVIIDELGFAPPLDDTGAQLLFRFVAAAYERRSLGIASHWPFESWGRFCPSTPPRSACSTGSCTTATPSSPTATPPPQEAGQSERRNTTQDQLNSPRRVGTFSWPPAGTANLAIDFDLDPPTDSSPGCG